MAADPTELTYELEIRIDASPATVFGLLTEPEAFASWMGLAAELDPRPGGRFHLDLGVATTSGEFVEVIPDRKVSFTWGWDTDAVPLPPGASRVEFELTPDGDGTILRFRHSGLTEVLARFHDWGWSRYLPRLAARARGDDPGPEPLTPSTAPEALAMLQQPPD